MRTSDLMVRNVASVTRAASLERAAQLMRDRACGCIAVVDEESRLVGILTDRDVCMAALRTGRSLSQIDVGAVMSAHVFACRSDDSIAEAERSMGQHQVRRLPIVDETGRLQGILSLDDIAREACREQELIAPPVSAEAVGMTLGQIARPPDRAGGGNDPMTCSRLRSGTRREARPAAFRERPARAGPVPPSRTRADGQGGLALVR